VVPILAARHLLRRRTRRAFHTRRPRGRTQAHDRQHDDEASKRTAHEVIVPPPGGGVKPRRARLPV
jgi:hypothetical protein